MYLLSETVGSREKETVRVELREKEIDRGESRNEGIDTVGSRKKEIVVKCKKFDKE